MTITVLAFFMKALAGGGRNEGQGESLPRTEISANKKCILYGTQGIIGEKAPPLF